MKRQILFLTGPLGGGGAERVLIDILRHFDYQKYDVDLALISPEGILLDEVPPQVHIIPLWSGYTLEYKLAYRLSKYLRCNALFAHRLNRVVTKRYDYEISFLEGMPLKLHAIRGGEAPKATWIHCDLDKFRYEAPQFFADEELQAYQKMDRIVAVSYDTLEAFRRRFPECTTPQQVIYNPIDRQKILQMAEAETIKNEKFTIVTVGRLTPPKAMDRIIRLAHRLKDEGESVEFQILGEGELRETLTAMIHREGVEDYVTLCGFQKNPFPRVKAADLLLCPSIAEGFCLVICEAMCLGVPVISTKTSGPCEILDNNTYGILCDHDDESIYQAVRKMLNEESTRQHYRQKALEKAKSFDINNTMEQIYKLIEQ